MAETSNAKPEYTAYIVSGSDKYNITPAIVSIDISDRDKQMAKCVTIELMNMKVGDDWLTSLLSVRDRVFLYANDGSDEGEVFRGYIWNPTYRAGLTERTFKLKCYDNLIYFQESEHYAYFSKGKKTEDVCSAICKEWGVKLYYGYESITHSKLPLRGNLADIFTADILDLVKDKTGVKYVILSDEDNMLIKTVGINSKIYHFIAGKNAIQTYSSCTMEGMVTKVIILGKADSGSRQPIQATIEGNTDKYGTLQKVISRDGNTSLAKAKEEAQKIIDEKGEPKWEFELHATDIPWIRKGDKVSVDAGDMSGDYIVTGISRTIDSQRRDMILDLEKPSTKGA